MWMKLAAGWLIAMGLAIGPATGETMQARCKSDHTSDTSSFPNKSEKTSDFIRSREEYDWVFAYDLDLGRACKVAAEGICWFTSDDFAAGDNGELKGSTKSFPSEDSGNLYLFPSTGRWAYQSGTTQTVGKAGDCTVSPASRSQIALVARDPSLDIDILCAGRLNVEAMILNRLGEDMTGGEVYRAEKISEARNFMAIANALLDRTSNRGFGRDEGLLAALQESEEYTQRSDVQRQADMAECEARLQELNR